MWDYFLYNSLCSTNRKFIGLATCKAGQYTSNTVIPSIESIKSILDRWYEDFKILDTIWLINEFFLWLREGQEAIICVNIIQAKHFAFPDKYKPTTTVGVKMYL